MKRKVTEIPPYPVSPTKLTKIVQESQDKKINIDFWYSGNHIVKLWEQYLKTTDENIKFYSTNNEVLESIFNDLSQQKEVVIVLDGNDKLHLNKNGETLTLCGEVKNQSEEGKKKIKDAIEQIKTYNENNNNIIINHVIIFPYHLSNHWNLGKITLQLESNKITKATIDILDPYGGQTDKSSNKYKFIIDAITSDDKNITIDISQYNHTKQQNDGTSCGAITAENGKEFLKKTDDNEDLLAATYIKGALELRENHVNEINLQEFYETQRDNKSYDANGDKPLENKDDIISDLNKMLEEVSSVRDIMQKLQEVKKAGTEEENNIKAQKLNELKQEIIKYSNDKSIELSSKLLTSNSGWREGAMDLIESHIETPVISVVADESLGLDNRYDFTEELKAEGLKNTLHGNMYQLGLLTLTAYRAHQANKKFHLITEAAEFEKFDDLVIDYGNSITFLQAKHIVN